MTWKTIDFSNITTHKNIRKLKVRRALRVRKAHSNLWPDAKAITIQLNYCATNTALNSCVLEMHAPRLAYPQLRLYL